MQDNKKQDSKIQDAGYKIQTGYREWDSIQWD